LTPNLPGPSAPPLAQALHLWRDPMGALQGWASRYGDLFSIRLPSVGAMVVVGNPDAVHEILLSDPETSQAGVAAGRVLPILGSHSVLRLDASAHLDRRRLLGPIFHGDNLVQHRAWISAAVERELATWPRGQPLPVLPRMQAIAFAVIAHLVLGLTDWQRIETLHRLVRRSSRGPAVVGTWMSPLATRPDRGLLWRAVRCREADVDRFLHEELRGRGRSVGNGGEHGDVVEALLHVVPDSDQRPDSVAVFEELRAILIVGHETTAAASTWAIERLTHNPDALTRAVESVRTGDATYLKAVIEETLRCRPPVVDAVRQLTKPMQVATRRLEAGTLVLTSPLLTHLRDDLYPRADQFNPDRFRDHPPTPDRWMPFGGGVRRCLGASLAVSEMTVILEKVLAGTGLMPATSRAEHPRLLGTMLVPSRGGRIVIF